MLYQVLYHNGTKKVPSYRNGLTWCNPLYLLIGEIDPPLHRMASSSTHLELIERSLAVPACSLPTEKVAKLKKKAQSVCSKNYRLRWYNSMDGQLILLVVPGHICISGQLKCSAICGGHKKGQKRPKTTIKCSICLSNLCRDPQIGRLSLWDITLPPSLFSTITHAPLATLSCIKIIRNSIPLGLSRNAVSTCFVQ